MLRRANLFIVACLVLLLGIATQAATPSNTPAQGGKKIRVALNGFENNLTPFTLTLTTMPNTHDLVMLVYDSLFWSQVKEDPEPWLAESTTASEDRKVWTVALRDGLTWHDGKPLTAEDVKFTFEYYLKFGGASGRYAHHVSDVPPFDRAEVVDPRTVRLYYRAPAPTFKILPGGDLPILPKHVWENITEPSKATDKLPVGSGPFKVVEIVADQRYRLQANPSYFKGKPTVDEIEVRVVRDPAAAFTALRSGEIDMVTRTVPPELADQFSGNPDLKVMEGTKFESTHLLFNARKPPLNDPKLRKAIGLGIDAQGLVDTILLGKGLPRRDGFIHPKSPWADPEGKYEYDPERAQKLLDEAGYSATDPDGVRKTSDGKRLEFSVLVSSFEPQSIRAVQLASQQVSKIGVKLTAETLDPATLRQRRQAEPGTTPNYDAYIGVLESHGHVDPDSLYYFFHSPGKKGFGAGVTGYSNPKFDQLAEKGTVSDVADRKPLMYEMQRTLAQEMPAIVMYYPTGMWAYRPAAYAGWVSDPGHGIFTKRSFLSEYVQQADGQSAGNDGNSRRNLLMGGIAGGAALLGLGAFLATRRRRMAEDAE